MKSRALPFLIALGMAGPTALAAGTSGHGMTSGAPAGSQAEAGMAAGQDFVAMPQPQTRGDITYLCGGIGETEASYMKEQARNYDVMMTFASQTGAFLANVDVTINRGNDQVLQASCDAPIMLVDMQRSGNYRIVADASGFEQTRNVRVDASPSRSASIVRMTWPTQAVAEMQTEEPVTTGGEVTGGGFRGTDITPTDQ